ncbi:hypothetical protein E0H62_14890 [Rhizobium leguminosarum bv. viciae]|nr:hypothetical protein E0H62_14890 [Rhizobium leguminosarum bv. viciae]
MNDRAEQIDRISILHVSDLHFGMEDPRAEIDRISESLIEAAHDAADQAGATPDICVFSGDMAFGGKAEEFDRGSKWLRQLLEPWPETKLFIVPGNHDVDRDLANASLRRIQESEKTFVNGKRKLGEQLGHLSPYFAWIKSLGHEFGDQLASNWSDPYLTRADLVIASRAIRLLGLNTALLSHDKDDIKHLVQDTAALNKNLRSRQEKTECVIAIGHHPLDWLNPWNEAQISEVLKQESGAHLYLHGHRHEVNGEIHSNSLGESLTTLECGAAYQESPYSKFFAFYTLAFSEGQVHPSTLTFAAQSGVWLSYAVRSRPFRGTLPPSLPKKSRSTSQVTETSTNKLNSASATPTSTAHVAAEMDARQHIVRIASATPSIAMSEATRKLASPSPALASLQSTLATITLAYDVLFHSDLVGLFRRLVSSAFEKSLFDRKSGMVVDIQTARGDSDALSVVQGVRDSLPPSSQVQSDVRVSPRETGPTLISVSLLHQGRDEERTPVRYVLGSYHECAWGMYDELLRSAIGSGASRGSKFYSYLSVLRSHFESIVAFSELIRGSADVFERERFETGQSELNLEGSQQQLVRFVKLPPALYTRIEEAFRLSDEADASRQFGGDPTSFRKAAAVFLDISLSPMDEVVDPSLKRDLEYTLRMERAYLLFCAENPTDLLEARKLYQGVLDDRPDDPSALMRTGQVLEKQQERDEAQRYFEKAVASATEGARRASNDQTRAEMMRIADFSRLNRALCNFRIFENASERAQKIAAIRTAILLAREIVDGDNSGKLKENALNDMIYYAWEERHFVTSGESPTLATEIYGEYAAQLVIALKATLEKKPSFREADTLARVLRDLDRLKEAREAASMVCDLLEKAARERGGGANSIQGRRLGPRWTASVSQHLRNNDERDALFFALEVIKDVSKEDS